MKDSSVSSHVIIGIDPGTIVTGYGVICVEGNKIALLEYGCIRPSSKDDLPVRYHAIFRGVCQILARYCVRALAVETQFVHKNVSSAMKVGMARAAAEIAAVEHSVEVFEYTPSEAKIAVVGNGRASKEQVQSMTRLLLGSKEVIEPQDASDALAIALCHANSMKYKNIQTRLVSETCS